MALPNPSSIVQRMLAFVLPTLSLANHGCASKFGYGSAGGDPNVWIGLDHRHFGLDRGYGSACGFRVWIGLLHFDSQHDEWVLLDRRRWYLIHCLSRNNASENCIGAACPNCVVLVAVLVQTNSKLAEAKIKNPCR